MSVGEILYVVFMIAGVIAFIFFAHANVPVISTIARGIWNLSCYICSFIPFIGWIGAKLIIERDKGDAALKRNAEETADRADDWGVEMAEQSVARSRAEQRRMEEQAELERRISREVGRTARIRGNTVDIGGKTYDLNVVKKKLKIQ